MSKGSDAIVLYRIAEIKGFINENFKYHTIGYRVYSSSYDTMTDLSIGEYEKLTSGWKVLKISDAEIRVRGKDGSKVTIGDVCKDKGLVTDMPNLVCDFNDSDKNYYEIMKTKKVKQYDGVTTELSDCINARGNKLRCLSNNVNRRFQIDKEGTFFVEKAVYIRSQNVQAEDMSHIDMPSDSPIYKRVLKENMLGVREYEIEYLMGEYILLEYKGRNNKVVSIPDGVTMIADFAFIGHTEVEEVQVPDSVWYVTGKSFSGISATKVKTGDSLKVLKHYTEMSERIWVDLSEESKKNLIII